MDTTIGTANWRKEVVGRVRAGRQIEVAQMPRGDVYLNGLSWDRRNLDLRFSLSSRIDQVELSWVLIARWAHGLEVNLRWAERSGGAALTWSIEFAQGGDEDLAILFDFASAGDVRCRCSALEIEGCEVTDIGSAGDGDVAADERAWDQR